MNNLILDLFLSLFIALLITENYGYGYWMISRPIFAGPLIGLLLGDLPTGLLVGGSVELMFMGVLPIGGSVPPNAQIAGIISTIFAIRAGSSELGIALAMPVGILAQFLIMLAWNINIYWTHRADAQIEKGNTKAVERIHLMGIATFFTVFFIACFLAVHFGSEYVTRLNEALPQWFNNGLKVAAGFLPAVGMAMLLKMMNMKKYWAFFLMGFVLAVYLNMNVLAVSLLGLCIAAGIYVLSNTQKEGAEIAAVTNQQTDAQVGQLLSKKNLWHVFWRSFFNMSSINYERYMGLGFLYSMIPALKTLYKDEEEYKAALRRHNEFYNCHPYTSNTVLGVAVALEEQRAMGKPITASTISAMKTALMGPLSGIGDSVFKATFMTIFAAIGAGLALDGNPLGPIIFLLPNVALNLAARYFGVFYGYKFGISLLDKMRNNTLIDKFVQGATIVGMMVTGAMVVSFVKVNLAPTWVSGGKEIVLQDMLNSILPSLLPLVLTLCFFLAMIKNKKATYWLVLLCFALGILGVCVGIF